MPLHCGGVVWYGAVRYGAARCDAARCGGVCQRHDYQMAMAGMPCIQLMQNGRAGCPYARCVWCVAHL